MSAVCPQGHTSSSDDYCDLCGAPIDPAAVTPTLGGGGFGGAGLGGAVGGGAGGAPGGGMPVPPMPPPMPPASGATPPRPRPQVGQDCPSCSTRNPNEALFCEACGYDFTTGSKPRPLPTGLGRDGNEVPFVASASASGSDASAAGPATAGDVPRPGGGAPDPATFDSVAEVWIDPAWYEAQKSPDTMPSPGLPRVVPLKGSRSFLIGRVSQSRNIHPEIDCDTDSGVSRRQTQLTTDGSRWWVEDLESANGTFVGDSSSPLPTDPIPVGPRTELRPGDRVYVGAWTRLVIRPATDDEKQTLA